MSDEPKKEMTADEMDKIEAALRERQAAACRHPPVAAQGQVLGFGGLLWRVRKVTARDLVLRALKPDEAVKVFRKSSQKPVASSQEKPSGSGAKGSRPQAPGERIKNREASSEGKGGE